MTERRGLVVLFVFLALYLVFFGAAALRTPFWFDEIFTAYLASLPSTSELLHSLRSGADLAPPLFHIITRGFAAIPGNLQLTLRLPALLGFGLACACVFAFVRRRCGLVYAMTAAMALAGTGASRYAIEARPYGAVLGCFGVALVCWQSAAEGRRRTRSLIGLGLSIAVAVSLHYYALLILVPVGAGEAVRAALQRRPDWKLWITALSGTLPLALHIPLIFLSRPYMHNAWAAPQLPALTACYFGIVASPVLLACLLTALAMGLLRGKPVPEPKPPDYEWSAAISLAALPALVYAAAVAKTGIFVDRYSLGGALGFAILLGFLLQRIGRSSAPMACLSFAALSVAATLSVTSTVTRGYGSQIMPLIAAEAGARPVVWGNPRNYLEVAYYNPSTKIRYIADPDEARARTGANAPDLGLLALRPWAPLDVEEYAVASVERNPFLLYWEPDGFCWLLPKLRDAGASVRLMGESRDGQLYSVEWP